MKKAQSSQFQKPTPSQSLSQRKDALFLCMRFRGKLYFLVVQRKNCPEQKLWDDNGSWFEAPTIRSLTEMGVQVAMAVATWGQSTWMSALASAAVNLADDAVFAVLDAGTGAKSWQEAGFGFGMKALTAAATFGIQQIGAGIMGSAGTKVIDAATGAVTVEGATGLLAMTGLEGIVARTAFTGAQTWTQNIVQGAIGGITYSDEDGLGYNYASLGAGMYGNQTGANVFGAMAQSFVSGSMNALLMGDGTTDYMAGFNPIQAAGVQTLGNLTGSLVNAGIGYGMTGSATFNVLNLADIGNAFGNSKLGSLGLLEWTVGKGAGMRIGSGGTDVSASTIGMAMLGMWTVGKNWKIDDYCEETGIAAQIAYRAQYGYGDEDAIEQMDGILAGSITLEQKDFSDPETDGQSITSADGQKTVLIEMLKEGMSVADQLKLALLLQHEAKRDGLLKTPEEDKAETQEAVKAHSAMALAIGTNATIGKAMIGLINTDWNLNQDLSKYYTALTAEKGPNGEVDWTDFNKYVDENYDSSADFWKYNVDGEKTFWTWDGSYDFDLTAIGMGVVSAKTFMAAVGLIDYDVSSVDPAAQEELRKTLQEQGTAIVEAIQNISPAILEQMNQIGSLNKLAFELEAAIWGNEAKPIGDNGRVVDVEDEALGKFAKGLSDLIGSGLVLKTFDQNIAAYATALFGTNLVSPLAASGEPYRVTSLFGIRLLCGQLNDHAGIDIGGRNNRLLAMGDGDVTYDWDSYGSFRAKNDTVLIETLGDGSLGSISDLSVSMLHLGAPTVGAMIGLAFTAGTSMSYFYDPTEVDKKQPYLSQTSITFDGVRAGQTIGYSGSTGWSYGAHTHLSMTLGGKFIDPKAFLESHGYGGLQVTAFASIMSGFVREDETSWRGFKSASELGADKDLMNFLYNALQYDTGYIEEGAPGMAWTDTAGWRGDSLAYQYYLNAAIYGWDKDIVLQFLAQKDESIAAVTQWWFERAAAIQTARSVVEDAKKYGVILPVTPGKNWTNEQWYQFWLKYGSTIEQMIDDALMPAGAN